jgi:hypothetical protein
VDEPFDSFETFIFGKISCGDIVDVVDVAALLANRPEKAV